jgi:hypothetical protein
MSVRASDYRNAAKIDKARRQREASQQDIRAAEAAYDAASAAYDAAREAGTETIDTPGRPAWQALRIAREALLAVSPGNYRFS